MTYTIYDPATGQIVAIVNNSDPTQLIEQNVTYIEGKYSGKEYYVDAGQAVRIPTKPTGLLQSYVFDWATKSWTLDIDATSIAVKNYRNTVLNQTVDKVNPIWYSSLSVEQQTELQTYRQALLDITSQTDFPTNVVWPTMPSWL